jgi:Protein of unknown function (DUF2393)
LEPNLGTSDSAGGRKWLPLAISLGLVLAVVLAGLFLTGRPRAAGGAGVLNPVNAEADPSANNFPLTNLAMSEAANMAGGKVTYIDGHIANRGRATVSGITVQVLFRNAAGEVAQNETMPMTLIRTREPYIDTEPVSVAPLKAGGEQDFRLIFDKVSAEWNGALPEIRILRVESK